MNKFWFCAFMVFKHPGVPFWGNVIFEGAEPEFSVTSATATLEDVHQARVILQWWASIPKLEAEQYRRYRQEQRQGPVADVIPLRKFYDPCQLHPVPPA